MTCACAAPAQSDPAKASVKAVFSCVCLVLWGDDATPAIVLLTVEFFLGGFDLLLHRFRIEARAFLHCREFDEGFGKFPDRLPYIDEAPEFVDEEIIEGKRVAATYAPQ
jgi:hypothetical protein